MCCTSGGRRASIIVHVAFDTVYGGCLSISCASSVGRLAGRSGRIDHCAAGGRSLPPVAARAAAAAAASAPVGVSCVVIYIYLVFAMGHRRAPERATLVLDRFSYFYPPCSSPPGPVT